MTRQARWTTRLAAWLGSALLLPALTLAADTPAPQFKPYTVRYQVSYRGLNGGEIEASFRRAKEPNQWQYETHAFPSLLGRLASEKPMTSDETAELQARTTGLECHWKMTQTLPLPQRY